MKIMNKMILGLLAFSIAALPVEARADRFHRDFGHYRGPGILAVAGFAGVATAMYYASRPTYIAVPQTVIVQQPQYIQQPQVIQPQVGYYCKATGTNYPDTMSCPGGWSFVTPGVPPQ